MPVLPRPQESRMRVRYVGPIEELDLVPAPPHPAVFVKRLEWIDVDDKVGRSLLEQDGWETEKKSKTEKEA